MRNGQQSLADTLPAARYQVLDGQTHQVKAKALAPVLLDFFSAAGGPGLACPVATETRQ